MFSLLKFEVVVALLLNAIISFAETAPQQNNGEAIVINKCKTPVFYVSMGNIGFFGVIEPEGVYREQYKLRYLGKKTTGEDEYGGISIMLSPNQTIATAADQKQALLQSTVTQFEYTYHPLNSPGLWYDISNVNGYVYNSVNGWNGKLPWPFQTTGLVLEGTSKECATVTCPGGNPNGNSTCVEAYTHSVDDWASHGCRNDNSIVLTLCSETSFLGDVIKNESFVHRNKNLCSCSP
ncbi:hypothetical protein B0O99DRAFT_527026 [Bisporella sp. PMI_857]|nr:hypothetical protein B0O99DRAFT_527026 [Bisporella sp. PMI_857]